MNVRASGVLLHITSLPSRYGIGDLGPSAYAFVQLMRDAGQLYWQFLPLGPTSPAIGNSPYSSCSAFAGNPLLISPELLVEEGYLSWADVDNAPHGEPSRVDYVAVEQYKHRILRAAFERNRHSLSTLSAYREFCRKHEHWLIDYTRFVTIKKRFDGAMWNTWPDGYKFRDTQALTAWDAEAADDMQYEAFVQFLFYTQWERLHAFCRKKGLQLIGDVPIYVTYDSADVWKSPQFFKLDKNMEPIFVAGVPPDYFSETGQRWGNPVYDWAAMKDDRFSWWVARMAHNFAMTDLVRIDHFRGFAGYWEIPAEEETAVNGEWVDAEGMALFTELARRFPALPVIAEDLGVITADVRELKNTFALPGMKILQFGFGGNMLENPDSPINHQKNSVLYTGTHDNAPVVEWFQAEAGDEGRNILGEFAGFSVQETQVAQVFMRLVMASVCNTAIFPVQDVLGLDGRSRMNTPAVAKGNWEWRMLPEHMHDWVYERFATKTRFFGRWS